ncbi:hypothetical protein Hdeb2414_s0006g00223771 [Helianthus debilis subsp. tardiflorus]
MPDCLHFRSFDHFWDAVGFVGPTSSIHLGIVFLQTTHHLDLL